MMAIDQEGELETAMYRKELPESGQSPRATDDQLRESNGFSAIAGKMLNAGLPELAVRTFEQHYSQLRSGVSRYMPSVEALYVPRNRFIPEKTNDDLVRPQSQEYRPIDDYRLETTHQPAGARREMVRKSLQKCTRMNINDTIGRDQCM